jgi:hypothetical protein
MGSSVNLELDLGANTLFTTTSTVNLSSDFSLSDLTTTYGSTPTDLFLGVTGTTGTPTDNIFITSTDGTIPTQKSNQATINNLISPIYGVYNSGLAGATGTTDSLVQGAGGTGTYTGIANNNQSVGTYNGAFPFTTQAQYSANGTEVLDLFSVAKGSGPATELGTITLTTSGTTESLIFQGADASAAPEPSTYALMGLGALALLAMRRRFVQS